jgi:exopolyphosphatase/guanosine-5'-triphosphate,3'-diphosphate pyrophosphatase
LTREDLQRTLERLLAMPLEERKKVEGMKPQRADILPGGIIVIETAMEIIGSDKAVATSSDLLLGILLQERDASAGQPQVAYTKASETRGRFRQ